MKTFTPFFSSMILACLLPVSNLMADDSISESAALQCIATHKNIAKTQQDILSSKTEKANLKSKIDYLTRQVQERRSLIEDLDQQHNQINNGNYNQLINQFDALMEERKETISLYDAADTQHLHQHEKFLDLEKSYSQQCLDNIQINKAVFKKVCGLGKAGWCELFSY